MPVSGAALVIAMTRNYPRPFPRRSTFHVAAAHSTSPPDSGILRKVRERGKVNDPNSYRLLGWEKRRLANWPARRRTRFVPFVRFRCCAKVAHPVKNRATPCHRLQLPAVVDPRLKMKEAVSSRFGPHFSRDALPLPEEERVLLLLCCWPQWRA